MPPNLPLSCVFSKLPNPAPRRWRLAVECVLLFFGVPLALTCGLPGRPVLPWLWLGALGCLLYLRPQRGFDERLWRGRTGTPGDWRRMLLCFAIAMPLLVALLLALHPDWFLNLPRQRPRVWLAVILLYPLLSAAPQGIVYRVFFFHRYRELFRGPRTMILASAVAFAFAHIVFRNPYAVALTLAGGLLFAGTYARTRSFGVSTAEHALYGDWLFTIGYGPYVYHGTLATLQQLAHHAQL